MMTVILKLMLKGEGGGGGGKTRVFKNLINEKIYYFNFFLKFFLKKK